jgi:hypothetical protein
MTPDTTDLGGHEVVPQQGECARNERRRATAVGSVGSDNAAALDAADVVCLAAAPTFAITVPLTGVLGGSAPDMLCSAMHDASPLSGIVLLYLLMSSFHTAPWLEPISGRQSDASRRGSGVRQIER